MKAYFEKIDPELGSSFSLKRFEQEQEGAAPFWHFHPEYEIVYISHGRGKRHIANHISYYEDGDLVFLGPNLPHLSFTEELSALDFELCRAWARARNPRNLCLSHGPKAYRTYYA